MGSDEALPPAVGDAGDGRPFDDVWDAEPAGFDPFEANLFTDEIENVDASAWDVDADLIWGDEAGGDEGDLGLDFPM